MIDIQTVKDSIVLSDVVSQYVKLKPMGGKGRWTGKCCFHDDKNPSFDVDDNRGTYKCFGCNVQGDVIEFIKEINGFQFKDALTEAKKIAGIEDEYLTAEQRKVYELKMRRISEERVRFKRWREEVIHNLKLYIAAQWKIYRTAKRQLFIAVTEELENQADFAYNEGLRKEVALEELEAFSDQDLMAYYKTIKSWKGIRQPGWFLSSKKLESIKSIKAGVPL